MRIFVVFATLVVAVMCNDFQAEMNAMGAALEECAAGCESDIACVYDLELALANVRAPSDGSAAATTLQCVADKSGISNPAEWMYTYMPAAKVIHDCLTSQPDMSNPCNTDTDVETWKQCFANTCGIEPPPGPPGQGPPGQGPSGQGNYFKKY